MNTFTNPFTARLAQLRAEHEAGQKMLTELDAKRQEIRDTLLRISGAIQVLDEELAKVAQAEDNGVALSPDVLLSRS
ncbi:hypothetical protein EYB53_023600 [Candidatus Chloroploca sp. M-50]|uniref:Uncharacterized protein n=1 Tax=Candidatus Chloroploca mongolica TaxID=2528176 RepID=A0ABS4DH15_9CHLR|nr:hypothetical protein [Candidatus Chloroploca mongolica]MBP1468720.1 hypothetical protein [Candidatus Chloroploca mongolica]